MSPEAIEAPAEIDGRADLYALGAVGCYLLTGKHVFSAKSVQAVCALQLFAEPTAPSELVDGVPADLEAVLLACLVKRADQRISTAEILIERLHGCVDAGKWTPAKASAWWGTHHAEPIQVSDAGTTVASLLGG